MCARSDYNAWSCLSNKTDIPTKSLQLVRLITHLWDFPIELANQWVWSLPLGSLVCFENATHSNCSFPQQDQIDLWISQHVFSPDLRLGGGCEVGERRTCLEVDVGVLELLLPHQAALHWSKLGTLGDTALWEDPAHEAVNVEHQGQAGTGSRQDNPVGNRVQRPMFQTHRGVCLIALLTPCW